MWLVHLSGMTEGEKEEARVAKDNLAQEQGEDQVEEEVVSDDDEAGRRQYKKSNQFKTHLKSSQVPGFDLLPSLLHAFHVNAIITVHLQKIGLEEES